jgi:hypothetical protein
MVAKSSLDRSVAFRVAGEQYRLSGRQVLEQARQAIADTIPPESQRYKEWVVDVDGQPVGVKWLFSVATGLDVRQFKTGDARRILPRLGIKVRSLKRRTAPVLGDVPIKAPPSDEMPQVEFLDQVAQAVRAHLPSHLTPSAMRNQNSYLQIAYPEFRISQLHYEVYLLKSRQEVALHFESALATNLAWLEYFKPQIAQLNQSLGYSVTTERWGRKSARVTISFPPRPLTAALGQEMGALMARFVQATYPIMQEALAAEPPPTPVRKGSRKTPAENAKRRYRLLDAEVHAIQDFLEGNSDSRPSDERLCYWVYLCLTFELHREGWQLFALIDPSQVPKTLYERTHRFAQACQVRAEVQA